ncbi:hypothetical protein [Actinokineospora pegani]|uniref:hypothetical protein n=1 Tax=Actinokineospora pegani TaxID=2654637 RepID=UPI0012E9E525|nr:hypothetical protein [Actinokineospora pegani]
MPSAVFWSRSCTTFPKSKAPHSILGVPYGVALAGHFRSIGGTMKNTAARKPIPKEIDRRLRDVVLARWLLPGVPVSATLAMWAAVAPGVGEFLQGSLLMLLPVAWMVRFIRHRLNPQVWPNSAAGGGVMVTYVGGPLPLLLFAPLNAGYFASSSSIYPHATMPLEVVEVLRLGPVEQRRSVLFDGSDRWPVAVGPGTALRIGFGRPERDWIFTTDRGEHLARLIQGRMAANA